MNAFGGPGAFDHDAYLAARASQDEEFDKTALVERYWSVLQNHVATLAELGLSEARRLGVPGARNAGKTFAGLADIGVITRADAERLTEVQDIRNEDQHRYPAQTLRLVRAMLDLNRVLPRFMKRYGDWFGKLPY
ncbi:MAG: hypothetical protein ACRDL0_16715 [Thermoleophilaceae bacterium]